LRVVLFVHGDSDGVCSGALAYRYFVSKGYDVEVVFTHPAGLTEDLELFASPGDIVFIADIALSETHLEQIYRLFKVFSREGRLIYIDHHPEPINLHPRELHGEIIHDVECSASELVYKYFERELGFEYSRVGLYGAIGDYLDETQWVKNMLREWDKRSIYFEAGILSQGLEASRKMYDFKRHVVKHLAENKLPSSLSELVVRALIEANNEEELRIWVKQHVKKTRHIGYVVNPPGSLGRAANYAKIYSNKLIGIAAAKHRNYMVMSLRASSENIDLNRILRKIAPKYGGTGGGHPHAAGARIPVDKFSDFINELDVMVDTHV